MIVGDGQRDDAVAPNTPFSNGQTPAATASDRTGVRLGGSRRVGSIPVKPVAAPDYTTPISPERARLNGAENGREP
jgi:hypothetical protein